MQNKTSQPPGSVTGLAGPEQAFEKEAGRKGFNWLANVSRPTPLTKSAWNRVHTGPTKWPIGTHKFADRTSVNKDRPCLVHYDGKFLVLPLHPDLRQGLTTSDHTFWVKPHVQQRISVLRVECVDKVIDPTDYPTRDTEPVQILRRNCRRDKR